MEGVTSRRISKGNQQALDELSNLGSGQTPDLGFDMAGMIQETPMEMPSFASLNPDYATSGMSDVFPTFSSVIPSQENYSTPTTLPPYFGIGLPTVNVTPNQNKNINDAFATLRQTVDRYNQGGM